MFDKYLFDLIDLPVDRIYWAGARVLPSVYPLSARDEFIGDFDLPFQHYFGVGTASQWADKFTVKLELAPSARWWFVMRSAACGHQKLHYDSQFSVPDMSVQQYIVTAEPRFLLPVETPVVIEYMHWLRYEYYPSLSVTSVDQSERLESQAVYEVHLNLRKG